MIHLNGNILCAIDCETTGLEPGVHEILEICILPLDGDLQVRRDILPFNIVMKPERDVDWEAIKVNKLEDINNGLDKWFGADLFQEWWEKLKLPEFKRIMPLAHNWVFDQAFIKHWLGPKTFDLCIDGRYRDSMTLALAINDMYERLNEPIPYPKVKLSYIAACLKLDYDKVHNALDDTVLTAKVYRELLRVHCRELQAL